MRIDFARIDLVGVDYVRVDLVAPNLANHLGEAIILQPDTIFQYEALISKAGN